MFESQKNRAQRIYLLIDAADGTSKTNLMYGSDLSFFLFEKYLDQCQKRFLISEENALYRATEKGKLFNRVYGLEDILLSTSGEEDPYDNSDFVKEIKVATSSLSSINNSIKDSIKRLEPSTIDFPKGNRDYYVIIEDIIDVIANPKHKKKLRRIPSIEGYVGKTQVMYKANLSFKQVNDYLNFLKMTNLIEEKTISKPRKRILYKLKEKGRLFRENRRLQNWILKIKEFPFNDSKLVAQIEAALFPMVSIEIPETASIISTEEIAS